MALLQGIRPSTVHSYELALRAQMANTYKLIESCIQKKKNGIQTMQATYQLPRMKKHINSEENIRN